MATPPAPVDPPANPGKPLVTAAARNEPELNRPGRTHRQAAPPSLFRYSPGLVLISIAIADGIRIADPDLWGHVRFGQDILRAHRLILYDTFTYSVPGHFWTDHEWLSQVLLAASFNWLGVTGLVLLKLACTAALAVFMVLAVSETEAPPVYQFGVFLFCAVVVKPQIQFRPQMFTFALFAAVIWLLTRDAYRRTGRLWLAIPILAVWANLHGAFIMGIAALGIYGATAGAADWWNGRGWRRAIELGTVTGAAALATLATPYGIVTWLAIAHALGDPYLRATITEWEPLSSELMRSWHQHGPRISNYEIGVLLMAATAGSWSLTIEAADLPLIAIAAMMSWAAFYTKRNLPFAAIAMSPPLARHLAVFLKQPRGGAKQFLVPRKRSWWINQGVLVTLSAFIFVHSGLLSTSLKSPDPCPSGACAFMKQHRLSGNILNDFDWGEYLIWHMAPDSKIFIDGRNDTVFPIRTIARYVAFNFDLHGAAKVLSAYPHDYVLISPESKSRKLMETRRDWVLIYHDEDALLYARRGSAAAKIPGVPVAGKPLPCRFP
ncbi:MAG: hypothetical protein ACREQI_06685 [Candidatus Binataceae bacterium]